MDSLLATYASSDEEDNQPQQQQSTKKPQNPNSQTLKTNLLFSKLPQPKSVRSDPFSVNPKKVVKFIPPVMRKVIDDDDDEEEEKKNVKKVKKDDFIPQAPSVKSWLSSIPAPRNSGSLGAGSLSGGTGRRSKLEAEVPELSILKDTVNVNANANANASANKDNSYSEYVNTNVVETSTDYVEMGYSSYGPAVPIGEDYGNYGGYEGYSDVQYESKWVDRSGGNYEPEVSVAATIQNVTRVPGKRGRNEIPQDIIEVSQDELMKNRPREDQVKATGIAFGPSYQPTSSTKGKPTKLHKRKHQIGSLYFDMRSKETELAERRSRGFLTKAETHAKYGW